MAKLLYFTLASFDGYTADEDGNFDWTEPDEEVHTFVNDLMRPVGTYLFGRRMYEVMLVWEDLPLAGEPRQVRDFAEIWRVADKVVYSRTLTTVATARTRLERDFDLAVIERMKDEAERDLAVAGPELAAHAMRAGLVDEYHLILAPLLLGGGKRALPAGLRQSLELTGERRFAGGMVYLSYRAQPPGVS